MSCTVPSLGRTLARQRAIAFWVSLLAARRNLVDATFLAGAALSYLTESLPAVIVFIFFERTIPHNGALQWRGYVFRAALLSHYILHLITNKSQVK